MLWMAVWACAAPHTLVVLVPDRDGHVGQARVVTAGGHQLLNGANQAAMVKNRRLPPEKIDVTGNAGIQSVFAEVMAAEPVAPEKFDLYFKSGTTQLNAESLRMLSEIVAAIRKRGSSDISINGHSDRAGSDAYNRDLSLDRALRIEALLLKAGIDPGFLSTDSHGEGNPLVPTPDNMQEPRNRRVEVIIR
jgi:outer membrane protein OmpA-like peptidoglycan-associated protein